MQKGANSLRELLTGPPAVKRTLFTETQSNESDKSSSDAEMDDVDRGNIVNNL